MSDTVNTKLWFRADAYPQTAHAGVVAGHEHAIEFDRTIFYRAGSGKTGDCPRVEIVLYDDPPT